MNIGKILIVNKRPKGPVTLIRFS